MKTPETIDEFDLTTKFYFSENHSEKWNERLAYTRSFKRLDFLKTKPATIFKNNICDFLSTNGLYDKDPVEEQLELFPESKYAQLYIDAFGGNNKRCYCCGKIGYPFLKPIIHQLCEECNSIESKRFESTEFQDESTMKFI